MDSFNGLPNCVNIAYANQENKEFNDDLGHPIPKRIQIVLEFSEENFGFGEVSIVQEDQTYIDTEFMGKEKVKEILNRLVDNAITETDEDPRNHKKFNKAMKRTCCDWCEICKGDSP